MRAVQVVRVFTKAGRGGNHLGVVNDVVGLDDELMQSIATELGFSETVYVDWADPTKVPFLRIFTPASELPFAGHPLVGTAWVMSELGPIAGSTLECPIGAVSFRREGELVWVDVPFQIDVAAEDDTAEVARGSGLPDPVRTWCLLLPKEYLIAEYPDADSVATLEPDMEAMRDRFGLYVFARDGSRVRARFFAPNAGVPEDPATGSAAVALAYALSITGEPEGALDIEQGEEMGHPSLIQLRWDDRQASIGGTVVRDELMVIED
jgi:trans-2,3-dihydro-3-hydroxyanthranilate isomerase